MIVELSVINCGINTCTKRAAQLLSFVFLCFLFLCFVFVWVFECVFVTVFWGRTGI